jgi:hypothetical protein
LDCGSLTFPDVALHHLVREALELPEGPIAAEDLARLTEMKGTAYANCATVKSWP